MREIIRNGSKRVVARVDGFTSAELVTGIAIVALLAAAGFALARGSADRFRRIDRFLQRSDAVEGSLAVLSRDLRAATISFDDDSALFSAWLDGDTTRLEFVVAEADESDRWLRRVSYHIQGDSGDGRATLWRRSEKLPEATESDPATAVPLCSTLDGFRCRFFDGESWSDQWGWDPATRKPVRGTRGLPMAVEIQLDVEGERTTRRVPVMVALLERSIRG